MDSTPFPWPSGKRAAVSLSFDDARPSQLEQGIPILDRYGVHATFYVTMARARERLADWGAAAIRRGHEIGNHSLTHRCSGNFGWGDRPVLEETTLEAMEADLAAADAQIRSELGVQPLTFAYPCGMDFVGRGVDRRSYVPLVARRYLAGRGFRDEYMNRPDFCDLARVGGTEMDGLTAEQMIQTARNAVRGGLWLVFVAHDVGQQPRQCITPEALERFCAWGTDPQNGIWIDTVAAVAACVQERRAEPRPGRQGNAR
ncbi:MAG: polysaccharide deacetylase family protein [Lentisphaeria bacterium]|nr:polysaccharide deacetylase family protein [Lentisphaeria bacterium]